MVKNPVITMLYMKAFGGKHQERFSYISQPSPYFPYFLFKCQSLSLLFFRNTSRDLPHPHSSITLVVAITDLVEALMSAFNLCMVADAC